MNQYQKIERALRQDFRTAWELIHLAHTVSPHKRMSEMRERGVPIRSRVVKKNGKRLKEYWIEAGTCANEECDNPNPPGREKLYCSDKCRAKQHRKNNDPKIR